MLVSDLIAWCNRIYEPDSTTYKVTDAQWISFFNEALFDLKPFIKLRELSTADIESGRADYGLPGDFHKMFLLQVYADGEFKTYDEILISDNVTTGYKLWEFITIQPTPTEDVNEGLKMYYYKAHPEIDIATDTIDISNPYLVGLYSLGRIETGDRILDMSNRYFREYAEGLQKLRISETLPLEDYLIRDVY